MPTVSPRPRPTIGGGGAKSYGSHWHRKMSKGTIFFLILFLTLFVSVVQQLPADEIKMSKDERRDIHQRYKSLDEANKHCVDHYVQKFHKQELKECERKKLGDNIGGGCAHLTGYWSAELLDEAMSNCKIQK